MKDITQELRDSNLVRLAEDSKADWRAVSEFQTRGGVLVRGDWKVETYGDVTLSVQSNPVLPKEPVAEMPKISCSCGRPLVMQTRVRIVCECGQE